eukprot:CAMPEP_0114994474 /NCGR_PEP_ID=MMETSP0216-20121206/13157_1 /TAXON_ID=223996 /ORGANISM="Protocruzia adherens, Strain Boccale" /LENGTH=217 /DNA_ID=CAMNT_0002358335 /DNA_START=41 /DNA_END=694 /DNA_ORIENTATION=+
MSTLGTSQNSSLESSRGKLIQRVLRLYEDQNQHPQDNNITFWKNLVERYFDSKASFKFDIFRSPLEKRSFEPCLEALPRIFAVKFESGVQKELLNILNPREYILDDGRFFLECEEASIVSTIDNMLVINRGTLRVIFGQDLKIQLWEFMSRECQEYVSREDMHDGGPDSSRVNEFGFTPEYSRCLLIAEVVESMKSKMVYPNSLANFQAINSADGKK